MSFMDVINLNKVSLETQEQCLNAICKNINKLREYDWERIHISQYGQDVLQQQLRLAVVLDQWAEELKNYTING